MPRAGLLLINLGTPSSPELANVRRYLRELLMDGRVLDMPAWRRFLLVHLVILPRRSPRSAESYRKIWTERGSPLLFHGRDLRDLVQAQFGADVAVALAMRYGEPSIRSALDELAAHDVDRLVLFPLYAHWSSAATESSIEAVRAELRRRSSDLELQVTAPFYDHPAYLEVKTALAAPVLERVAPDLVVFSFHGLPEHQPGSGSYRTQCVTSADLQAERLGLSNDRYRVSFQSRLGRTRWIAPYTDEVLAEEARRGRRRVVVVSGFVADCLETLEEIGIRGRDTWLRNGGEAFERVAAPNACDAWAKAVVEIARPSLGRGA